MFDVTEKTMWNGWSLGENFNSVSSIAERPAACAVWNYLCYNNLGYRNREAL